MRSLADFGWTESHQQEWDALGVAGAQPARVVADFGTSLKVAVPEIITAELSGRLAHYARRDAVPKVGDWVAVAVSDDSAVITSVELRKNEIARKVTGGRTQKQAIAANVDSAFVLLALDDDFSVERLKRFLYQLSVSAVQPVIVLNKADKTHDIQSYTEQLRHLNVPIIVTTATEGKGIDDIALHITPGTTALLLGSSGVGKSTITNQLLKSNVQAVGAVRESDSKGRHTTVHRELFILPNGGILIDTPGIRELQLWGTEDELAANYDDITALMAQCKYTNCQHAGEQGCAVTAALTDGTLDAEHYDGFIKMKRELSELATKKAARVRRSAKHTARRSKRQRYSADEEL